MCGTPHFPDTQTRHQVCESANASDSNTKKYIISPFCLVLCHYSYLYPTWRFPEMGVPPESSILMGYSIINQAFWGTPILGNLHMSNSCSGDVNLEGTEEDLHWTVKICVPWPGRQGTWLGIFLGFDHEFDSEIGSEKSI